MTYIQGFVIPVPTKNKAAYRKQAKEAAGMFMQYGATRIVECWGDDILEGKTTDFRRAVKANEDENIVFAWIEWPDRKTCKAAQKKMEADPDMQPGGDMPFDGKRLIYGGFKPIFEAG